jgi:hypothetical protein
MMALFRSALDRLLGQHDQADLLGPLGNDVADYRAHLLSGLTRENRITQPLLAFGSAVPQPISCNLIPTLELFDTETGRTLFVNDCGVKVEWVTICNSDLIQKVQHSFRCGTTPWLIPAPD